MPLFSRKFRGNTVKKSESYTSNSNSDGEDKDNFNADFSLEIGEITLQLGSVTSTFMPDGSWQPRPSSAYKNSSKQKEKLLKLKIKNEKLTKENEKLNIKFDTLLDIAKLTSSDHKEVEQELKNLRHILRKAPISHRHTRS